MSLKPLTEEMPVEFIVNDVGSAMLLHRGPLARAYAWVQYDRDATSLQLITENGDLQDLGMKIKGAFMKPLAKTKELMMIELGEDSGFKNVVFLKCTQVVCY